MPSRESARRGAALLRAYLERGLLGSDVEAASMFLDLIAFVEDDDMPDASPVPRSCDGADEIAPGRDC